MKTMTTEYKLLKAGDKIEPGDEVLMAGSRPDGDDWRPLRGMCGDFVKPENAGFIRRPIYKTTRCCGDTVEDLIEENKKLKADLFTYGEFTTNVAKALGMGTYEISFNDVVERIKIQNLGLDNAADYINKLERDLQSESNWADTAAQYARDVDFYHGIVTQIGNMFGILSRISDDGSLQDDVLALKVPLLVENMLVGIYTQDEEI